MKLIDKKVISINKDLLERDYLFDNIKALLIFLVVLGHVIDTERYPFGILRGIYFFIYFFHMPAFIFISGYFSKNVDKCREKAFKSYLIPYILVNVLLYIQIILTAQELETVPVIRFFTPIRGWWFLLSLFIWKLMIKDLIKIRNVIPLLFLLGLIAGFSHEFGLKLSLSRLAVFSIFFVAGYYTQKSHIDKIRAFPKLLMLFLVGVIAVCSFYLASSGIMSKSTVLCNTYYRDDFLLKDFSFRIIFYLFAIIMIVSIINLMTDKKSLFYKIGQNTIYIYVFHLFTVRFLDIIIDDFDIFNKNILVYGIYVVISSIIITYVFSRQFFKNIYDKVMNFAVRVIYKG